MKTARKMAVRWMAPETIESFLYTQKSDVYCYGVRFFCQNVKLVDIIFPSIALLAIEESFSF